MARQTRIGLAGVAAAVLMVAPAPSAHALSQPSHFRLQATRVQAPVTTDGTRYAVYVDSHGRTVVIDTKRGTRRTFATPRNSCGQSAGGPVVGAGRAAWLISPCHDPRTVSFGLTYRLRLLDLKAGAFSTGPTYAEVNDIYFVAPIAIGSQWVELHVGGNDWDDHSYLDWHTGQILYPTGQPAGTGAWPDVSALALSRPLCSPLTRERDPSHSPVGPVEHGPTFYRYEFERPFGLSFGDAAGLSVGGHIRLERCGHPKPLVRCDGTCMDAQLGGGLLSWYSNTSKTYRRAGIYAYDTLRRRSYRWLPPTGPVVNPFYTPYAAHTRNRLFISPQTPQVSANGPMSIYEARIPR